MAELGIERMISHWWSKSGQPLHQECEDWITNSYADPDAMWESVFTLQEKMRRSPLRSTLGKSYDFYHDCILRHIQSNDIAYTIVGKDQPENWTYKQLHHCVNYHLRKWSSHNPQPGQLAALIVSPGIRFVIGLLAALRLGLTICFLPHDTPTLGNQLIKQVLKELNPQWIITEHGAGPWSADITHLTIDPEGQDDVAYEPQSFAYKALHLMQTALALYRQESFAFVPLDAHTAYLHALRDALFGLNLTENTVWAAPLSCPLRTEPCSTLMTFLAGARMMHIPRKLLLEDPMLLKNEKIPLIGISAALQQLWTRQPGMPRANVWFNAPFDNNVLALRTFVQMNKLEKTMHFQLLMDNSSGGVTWSSRPQPELSDPYIKASPGMMWSLEDLEGSEVNATPGYGVFSPILISPDNNQKTHNITFSQTEQNGMFTGFLQPTRDGVTFPVSEVEDAVHELPFVENCILLPLPKVSQPWDKYLVLVVFVDPMNKQNIEKEQEVWKRKIFASIQEKVGGNYVPDQIDYYPLLPKRRPWGVDRDWCSNQYRSGLLKQKMEDPLFQLLHVLKKLAAGSKTRIQES